MNKIVRSVYGAYFQTCQLMKVPMVLKPFSTLNDKLNINQDILIGDSDKPSLDYVCIGNGGHISAAGPDGISFLKNVFHKPTDASLFNHLPFVLRLPQDDLSTPERLKYRLRRLETHDGIVYVAYYLKLLDKSATVPQLELRTVSDGVTTSTTFVPSIANLNPTPQPLNTSSGVITTNGSYVAVTSKVPFILTPNDILEYLNVCNIIYGTDDLSMITEIGLCTGVDKTVVGNFNGLSIGYTDAIGVQIANFIATTFFAKANNDGINWLFDIGSVEPLLVLS